MGNKAIKKRFEKEKKSSTKIVIILLVLITISSCVLLTAIYLKNSLFNNIKNSYNKNVITINKASLYDKNNKIIGSINKGYNITLKKYKIKSVKDKYFNIENTKYYVYYKDVKPSKENKIEENDKYLVFNKNIKTKKKTEFYVKDKKMISIKDGINLPIQYIDDNYYYVKYLNGILGVKKSKDVEEIDSKNTEEKESNYISVIHFNKIYGSEECKENTCISVEKVKAYMDVLKEKGFYTISLEEYKNYLDKKIRLKEKAILLTTSTNNETVTNYNKDNNYKVEVIDDKTGLKFSDTNTSSNKDSNKESINRYIIKINTSDEDFNKMILGEEVKEIVYTPSVNRAGEQSIPVLNYHFFYDPSLGEECNEGICLDVATFRQHLDYLRDNNYKTLTMDEFRRWMYGEIELPAKSVLITVDDGAMGTGNHNGNKLIPLLEEYKMHATLFLIAGWWSVENYRSKYLDIQSHTYDMHQYGSCGRGQVNCATKEELMADLQKSLTIVDNNNAFCFPFYYYSESSLQTVREAGFKLAFIGGSRQATRSDNKYLIPRYPIHKGISIEQFMYMVR